MRIIGGELGGRRIKTPGNLLVRPTTDMAKEAIFNILGNRIDFEGIEVLDLFSGTGNMSYEFSSRGAERVVSVEMNARNNAFIKSVITQLGIEGMFAIRADVFQFIERENNRYDIIFCDPPYDLEVLTSLPGLIKQKGLLKDEGILILEHSSDHDFSGEEGFIEVRKYGRTRFSFFN